MKLSYNWLKEYLHTDLSPEQIAEAMTAIGIEVDSVDEENSIATSLEGVVVAKVLECAEHPNSDHLHICKVDTGAGEPLQVVCGAPNVAAGQKVLFAGIGTVLPGDFKIKKSKIRSVESFGMICAEDELGIGESHDGIMVLEEEAVIGMKAKDYLKLETETIIEYEITANRIDAASHIGVARDLYAYLRSRAKESSLIYPQIEREELKSLELVELGKTQSNVEGKTAENASNLGVKLEVEADSDCARYVGIEIKNVAVAPSPDFIQKRLRAIGLNPINNIVDISNYVLFETGQPLHIFDADKIKGSKLIVRKAKEAETLKFLDGVERKLYPEDTVIADSQSALVLAGVMGGEEAAVSSETKNIFIEAAYFSPGSIRKSSKRHGIQSDSSFRFERGADPNISLYAAKRAAELILSHAGGELQSPAQEFYPEPISREPIKLSYEEIEKFIGKKIGANTIDLILESLSYKILEKNSETIVVEAPSYMIDVYRPCDVIEEILRIYGYDNIEIPENMKVSISYAAKPDPDHVINNISNYLVANGFVECMNNSLTKSDYYKNLQSFPEENCVRIVNPLSSDLNVMRQSLLLSGLEVIAYNLNRQQNNIKIFEYGSVYSFDNQQNAEELSAYKEHKSLALFMSGSKDKQWNAQVKKSDFFDLKLYVEQLLARYNIDIYTLEYSAAPADLFSEGISLSIPGSSKPLLSLGRINPKLAKSFSIKQEVFAAEIHWENYFSLIKRAEIKFKELPKFPELRRDLAIIIDESVDYASLRKSAFRVAKKLLKNVDLVDVYRGDKIAENKKQYALSFTLQDPEKTLTDIEVEKIMKKLLSTFENEFGAVLR